MQPESPGPVATAAGGPRLAVAAPDIEKLLGELVRGQIELQKAFSNHLAESDKRQADSDKRQAESDRKHAEIIDLLARGHSRLPTPDWPRFNDTYRGYYTFKEKLSAYIKDYGYGVSQRSLAMGIRKHCLSKGTADFAEFADSPEEILKTLGGLFERPSRLIDSLMDPVKKQRKVPLDDWSALLAYLTIVRSTLKEVDRLGVSNLFYTEGNIDAINDKMPSEMVRKWMEHSKELPGDQLGTVFERFITQEWEYATAVISRTTSA
jgi:hypothetical protein